jgi:hypothetical protein
MSWPSMLVTNWGSSFSLASCLRPVEAVGLGTAIRNGRISVVSPVGFLPSASFMQPSSAGRRDPYVRLSPRSKCESKCEREEHCCGEGSGRTQVVPPGPLGHIPGPSTGGLGPLWLERRQSVVAGHVVGDRQPDRAHEVRVLPARARAFIMKLEKAKKTPAFSPQPMAVTTVSRDQRPVHRPTPQAAAEPLQTPVAAASRTKSAKSRGGRPRARWTPSLR